MENEAQTAPRGLTAPARWALQALAGVCVLLGLIGIVVPVLPTVPFLLVAAWAASRSSPRLHRWLLTHPRFGRPLREWEEAGIVPRPAKWFATGMIAVSGPLMAYLVPAGWRNLVLIGLVLMLVVLVWLWRRPEHRPGSGS
jgi:uncharacterized membrane protein YbaN (DUF454 family)